MRLRCVNVRSWNVEKMENLIGEMNEWNIYVVEDDRDSNESENRIDIRDLLND